MSPALLPSLTTLLREPPPLRPTRRTLPLPAMVLLPVLGSLALLLALFPGLAALLRPEPPPLAVLGRFQLALLAMKAPKLDKRSNKMLQ